MRVLPAFHTFRSLGETGKRVDNLQACDGGKHENQTRSKAHRHREEALAPLNERRVFLLEREVDDREDDLLLRRPFVAFEHRSRHANEHRIA